MKEKISVTIDSTLLSGVDSMIDNIYIRNRSHAIEHLLNIALGQNKTAVILCGGNEGALSIGKDFRPTVSVKGKPVILRAVEKLRHSGYKTIYIVARQKLLTSIFQIIKDGSPFGLHVNYIEETSSSGSADTLRLLKGRVTTDFLVIYGDILFNRINLDEIWIDHLRNSAVATIMMTTSSRPSEKGMLKVEGNKVLEFAQKPKISDIYLVFSPIFIAAKEIFDYKGSSLEKNVFPQLAKKGLLNGHLSSEKEIHVHTKEDLSKFKSELMKSFI